VIPVWLVSKVGSGLAKAIVYGGVLLVIAVILTIGKCSYDRRAATEIKLGKAQGEAALQSGKEAVSIVGNRQDAEQVGAAEVKEAQDAIDNATDPAAVTDAGLAGLRAVRRRTPDSSRR